jgi:hypothetical protein
MIGWLRERAKAVGPLRTVWLWVFLPATDVKEREAVRKELLELLLKTTYYGIVAPYAVVRRAVASPLPTRAGWTKIHQSTADRALFEEEAA